MHTGIKMLQVAHLPVQIFLNFILIPQSPHSYRVPANLFAERQAMIKVKGA